MEYNLGDKISYSSQEKDKANKNYKPKPVKDGDEFDVIIIGSGAAGYPAAVYAGRFGLKTLVIGGDRGGLLKTTHIVENYPGFIRLSGPEIMDHMESHVKDYQIPVLDEWVKSIENKKGFVVKTDEKTLKAKAVILATGTEHKKLGVPGEKEYYGKGVSYCASCDGPLFKGKVIGVVGGSDSAAKEALLLSEYGSKVYIIYRRENIRPEPINMQRVEKKIKEGKIEIVNTANVLEVKGDKTLSHVMLDRPYKGSKEFKLGGLFIAIGHIPQSHLGRHIGVTVNEKDEIVINKMSETNIPGFFAAGDVVNTPWKQAIIGAAEGCMAAYSAYEHINSAEHKPAKKGK